MPPATTGRYRVLDVDDDRVLLADRDDEYDPVAVTADPAIRDEVEPGNLIEAEVSFGAESARLLSATVERATVYEYVPDADVVFEAARDLWQETRAAGDGMGSRVTRDTDGAVNGVVYVFADTPTGDRIEEFQSGRRPLDPLVERVADAEGEGPRGVFVVSPDDPFVVVTITLEPDGLFANTMRETYDLPGAGDLDLDDRVDAGGEVPDLPGGLGDDLVDGGSPDATPSGGPDTGVETDSFGSVDVLGHEDGADGDDADDEE